MAVIQKPRDGLSPKRKVANRAVNNGDIPRTIPPCEEGRSCIAIAMEIGKTKEIRMEMIPSVGRSLFWGRAIFFAAI
jgi:hypothetical protein